MTDLATELDGIDALRAQFNGQVILPEDSAYEERREHFNHRIDRRPAVIAVPAGTADVVAAVKFARAADLEIAVSSGGKNPAGFSRTEGGIVIDLSGMRGVKVDADEQTAWIQGGANGGDLQAEALVHGLGGVIGWMRATGVGGVNLNGGFGVLSNKLGLAVDTILELELVTAEGDVLRVAPDENPDLFWALRGAAPNFGIVTWVKQRLTPVPEQVTAGWLSYAIEDAPRVMGMLERYQLEGSEDFTFAAFYSDVPDLPDFPEDMHGKPMLSVAGVHIGDLGQAEEDLRPLRELGPKLDGMAPQGLFDFMCSMDEYLVPSRMFFHQTELSSLSEKAIDILNRGAFSLVETGLHGEITAIPWGEMHKSDDPGAFPAAQPGTTYVMTEIYWDDPADDAKAEGWAKSVIAELRDEGTATGVVFSNLDSSQDIERDRSSYGEENWKRLTELKAKYDPENVFHLNHNIPPA
jgi:FAD/FMN-containing dehydrogenase